MKNLKITGLPAGKSIAFIVAVFLVISIQEPVAAQKIDTAKLDELFNYLNEQNEAMGSLAVSKNGEVIYSRSIGYRFISEDEKIPADTDTKYRIWSITKLYTATMILQLIEEGKLRLDTPLDTYFPEFPFAKSVTIEQMLKHRSGIHDFTQNDSAEPWTSEIDEPITHETMIKTIASYELDFPPNTKFQYSNSNYFLLGSVIEKLDGGSYGKSLQSRILSRIGASNTYFGAGSLDSVDNKSFSYQLENGEWIAVSEGDFSGLVPGGAGSIVSTPSDMVLFIESLFTEELISKSSLEQMTDISDFYGMGIFKMPFNGETGFGHTGGYIASHSSLTYYPEEELAVAYCTNGQVYRMEHIMGNVLGIYFDSAYVLPHNKVEIELDEETLQKYLGVYETPQFSIIIELEGSHLTAQPTGRQKSILFALKKDFFFLKEIDIEIEFGSDRNGKVDKLYVIQSGRKIQAIKSGE